MYSFKFPTTSLIIDDNEVFVAAIKEILDEHNLCAKALSNHSVASFLKNYRKFLQGFNNVILERNDKKTPLRLDNILKFLYNPDRFKIISTLIVDYNMPGINGYEICQMVPNDFGINKIILTGEMWAKNAISLLDSGVIDGFLEKGGREFADEVTKMTRASLEHCKFFQVIDSFFVLDDKLRKFVEEFVNHIDACEYYIFNKNGSYIFLDDQAKMSGLMILSREEMVSMYEFLKIEFPNNMEVELIKVGEKMPVLFSPELDLHKMRQNIVDCGAIDGDLGTYYYVYTDKSAAFNLDFSLIKSYKQFLQSQENKVSISYMND